MGSRNNRMIGYHANDEVRCNKFLQEQKYLIISEKDTEYLGTGMYFWEHKCDAQWWLQKKKEQGKACIVKADIRITDDNTLDLTDSDIAEKMGKLIEIIEKSEGKIFCSTKLGEKLDCIFRTYSEMSKYEIIKGRRYYETKPESSFLRGTQLTTKVNDFYCVKCIAPIGEREKVA